MIVRDGWSRTWRCWLAAVVLLTVSGSNVCAQTSTGDKAPELLPPAAIAPTQSSGPVAQSNGPAVVHPVDAQQVVELSRSGLDEQIIADLVRERGVNRPLTVEDLLFLRRSRVSNVVIRAMQQAAPKATVYEPPATILRVQPPPPPPPVIIRTTPTYYWGFGVPLYARPHHPHPYRGHPHPRGPGRISFGISF